MAKMTLLPSGESSVSSDWVIAGASPESTRWESLDDDNGATSYVSCNDNNAEMTIEFANPSVAEADIDFSVAPSVRFVSSGRSDHRRVASLVAISFEAPAGVSAYTESCSYDAHASSFETINGTARATSDGVNPWTYADLEGLEMKCTKSFTAEIWLSFLALEVTYTEAVAADNATFFGANF
jgi:hypothetical protein